MGDTNIQSITMTPKVLAQVERRMGLLPSAEQRIEKSGFDVGEERSSAMDGTGYMMCGSQS